MSRAANFIIIHNLPGEALVIKDFGPWEEHLTVTNDADDVVLRFYNEGKLPPDRRLFWIDSAGSLDELLWINKGTFIGFHAGPRPRKCRVCGCTEDHACEGGCSWVAVDLCSVCAEKGPEA